MKPKTTRKKVGWVVVGVTSYALSSSWKKIHCQSEGVTKPVIAGVCLQGFILALFSTRARGQEVKAE